MKQKAFIITSLFLLFALQAKSQSVTDYFRSADFDNIYKHMAEDILYQTDTENLELNRDEAIRVLRNHYRNFQPVEWDIVHSGASDGKASHYYIIKMYNAGNNGIRLFIYTEELAGQKKISGLKFRRLL